MNTRLKELIIDLMIKCFQLVFGMMVIGSFISGRIFRGRLIVGVLGCIIFVTIAIWFALLTKEKN